MQAELVFEPAHHPVAAVHLEFKAVGAWNGSWIWRNERDHLDVAGMGGVDGGRAAVTDAANVRLQAS
jgi:hypothetical protein